MKDVAARYLRRAIVCALLAAALVAVSASTVHAATMTASTTDDELNADGDCSLREAIEAANTDTAVDACPAGSGPDTIVVPAGIYTLSISGLGEDANATGDLDITADLTINGAGAATAIIDGGGLDQVFHVLAASVVGISGLTVRNGSRGGIINYNGTLTLNNSSVSDNTGGYGAGMTNGFGILILNSSTVSRNSATGYGGGIINWDGTLTLNNSTVSSNSAGAIGNNAGTYGGGIINGGTLTLNNSTVSGNYARESGGGIVNNVGGATVAINNSTISGNIAGTVGGIAANGTLKNTIVANNEGGGLRRNHRLRRPQPRQRCHLRILWSWGPLRDEPDVGRSPEQRRFHPDARSPSRQPRHQCW